MYMYKILRLIFIGVLITYFLGCGWFYISHELNPEEAQNDPEGTWYNIFLKSEENELRQVIKSCYFAITTLSTVGYGDIFPISNLEMIIAVVVMLCGVAFFSYIMGNFIENISEWEIKMGLVDKTGDLESWVLSLSRYAKNQPLPTLLHKRIDDDFNYLWANDRLISFSQGEDAINILPVKIKRQLVSEYLFVDIFHTFNRFFSADVL